MKPLAARYNPVVTTACIIIMAIWAWVWMNWIGGDFESRDYILFVRKWIKYIQDNGYWHALGDEFCNYMPFYTYFLVPIAAFASRPLIWIKWLSVLFTAGMAVMAGLTVYRSDRHGRDYWVIWTTAAVVMMLPTITLNATVWGQCDAIYTGFLTACLYFLTQRRGWPAMAMMGLALATKMQASVFLPLIYFLLLKRVIKWRTVIMVPLMGFLTFIPALIEGRSLGQIANIYLFQTVDGSMLSFNFPNIYSFIYPDYHTVLTVKLVMVIAITVITLIGIPVLVSYSNERVTRRQIVWLAYLSALIYPFFLPGMHDRFLMPAEVVSVIFAFLYPRKWWFALLTALIAIPSYCYFLFNIYIDMQWIVPLYFITIILATRGYIKRYRHRGY